MKSVRGHVIIEEDLQKIIQTPLPWPLLEGKTLLVTGAKHHNGIIIAGHGTVYELARRTLIILNRVTADEMEDQLHYI